MSDELFARFKKVAVEVLSVDESAVVREAKLGDDLDADVEVLCLYPYRHVGPQPPVTGGK